MFKTKYVRTENDEIIVFPEMIPHSTFAHRKPVSAGFIEFKTDAAGKVVCECSGHSVGLDLMSQEDDSDMANIQLLNRLD